MDLGTCKKCGKAAIIALDAGATPLCAQHYVEQEDEGCLEAFLKNDPGNEIIQEVKKQKPQLYEKCKGFF